jgi:hypothetical protein
MTAPQPATDDPAPITDGNGTTRFFTVYDKFSAGVQITSTGPHEQRLTNVVRGRAMLFIPQAVSLAEQVPMLVYYHGHHGPSLIEGYIKEKAERDFRPLLKDKKVLLVEPQGGPLSRFEFLGTPAGLTLLLWRAMQKAFEGPPERKLPKQVPNPSSLILVGFSGGGAAVKKLVLPDVKADYTNRLTAVWCFDSMYSGEGDEYVNWARKSKKTLRVRVSTTEDTGKPRAQAAVIRAAKKAPRDDNIDIDKAIETSHEKLPGLFIPGWL